MSRRRKVTCTAVMAVLMISASFAVTTPRTSSAAVIPPGPGAIDIRNLSAGGRAWFQRPAFGEREQSSRAIKGRTAHGTNVDANDPQQDLVGGQSETAIAAAGATVVAAWNDATGYLVQPTTDRRASLTGLGVSVDRGKHFRDLLGLRNNQPNQQWGGDPTIARIDSSHFVVGSLYVPPATPDCGPGHTSRFQLAVEVVTVRRNGTVALGLPVVVADGGDACPLFSEDPQPAPDLAMLDKEWLSYDPTSRILAMSYSRFFLGAGGESGTGQIELVRAHLPAAPDRLSAKDWSRPIPVWPEEKNTVNQGAYVSVARNGDAYVAWEHNLNSFNGDPYVYVQAARIRSGDKTPVVGGPANPRVVTLGQRNSSRTGGVKSLDAVGIAGYNLGVGQDFPRIAVNARLGRVLVLWNDASAHPLGDIWMRALPMNLAVSGRVVKVNDDKSFALHFLPALSVRSNGAIVTSWYDRRRAGPNSTRTDYFGEVRRTPTSKARDFRITTGSTDWAATSAVVGPNFGDYTDNASTGNTTYFTWSDGRLGVPQPFVDRHR
jgi:hypothetical protein